MSTTSSHQPKGQPNKEGHKDRPPFSKLRAVFFPIYLYELKKVLPMGLIFFFILFNYTCLRNIKDTLVVNSTGAETLQFLKTFCVTPSAIIFMFLYMKGSNIFSREKLFYVTLTPFILFFFAFGFLLYPNKALIHPSAQTILHLKATYPYFQWFFAMYEAWTFSLFYVLSEIWGSAILSLLFWQFANQITRIPEAKRFYAFFGLIGQFSLIVSGYVGDYFSRVDESVTSVHADPWGYSLYWLMGSVFVSGIVTMSIYWWMHRAVLTDKRFYDETEQTGGGKKKKPKLSMGESLKAIFTSPYLLLIVALVVAYGTTVNFVEGLWKSQLQIRFSGNKNAYNVFMSQYTLWTGVATIIMMIVGSNILRLFSWTTSAIITPVTMLITGGLFFTFVLFREPLTPLLSEWGTNPLIMAVFMGATVVMITKATKYALFDLTKEMAYIPLDDEMKVKGKAAVDVVGGRLGKSTGSTIQVILLSLFPVVNAVPGAGFLKIAPIVAGIFVIFCIIWIISVKALGKRVAAMSPKS
jgi:AAA family ATP:ADP antiporter